MNERIRKLAVQAGFNNMGITLVIGIEEYHQKFAELIVKECANMAESFHHHQYDFTGNLELHEFIREHFGVEK